MTRCPTFTFQISIMPKCLAKHISTKVSFNFTIRKIHFYIDIGWPWIWNQYFYLGIWNDDCTKIIVLPSFQPVTRINAQNRNENVFINLLWQIILWLNIGISNWHNWNFDPTNMKFLTLFSSLHVFWPTSTWNSLVHKLWCKMERCENVHFSTSKCEKRNQLKHKTKCITDFLPTVRFSRINDYTCH